MYLGIDPQTGLIYEGSGNPDLSALRRRLKLTGSSVA